MTRRQWVGVGLIALALVTAAVLFAGVIRHGIRDGFIGGILGATAVLLSGISLTIPNRRR